MMFRKIAIIGVGLIGGSMGMACRKKKLASKIVGIGRSCSSINKALRLKAIDEGTLNLGEGIEGADLIIIATPINIVVEKIKECVFIKNRTIVIDVASVKSMIVKKADKLIKNKKNIHFIGTHPMAGSEESGVAVAKAGLFNGSVCIITPTKTTNKAAASKIKKFWEKLGAKTISMPADRHDSLVAHISHLPHLLAYSICRAVPVRSLNLAGSGFKSLTRIAKSNPEMWSEIFINNKSNILKAKKVFDKNIKLIQANISRKSKKRLVKRLQLSRQKRDSIG